ncbi:hypothetical protein O1M63_08470 [Streptomyces mirabilis]|nr:hypothetical protein [Streptomyces mirabilis]
MSTHTAGGASGTLETVTAALGNDVLRAVLLPEPSLPVGGVRVHEPGTAQSPGRGDIVLAIGMDDVTAVTALLAPARRVAAAVATKCRVQDDADVLRAAADSGCGCSYWTRASIGCRRWPCCRVRSPGTPPTPVRSRPGRRPVRTRRHGGRRGRRPRDDRGPAGLAARLLK